MFFEINCRPLNFKLGDLDSLWVIFRIRSSGI